MRKITSLILTLAMLLVGLLPSAVASASDTGTSLGSFTISNSAPVVSALEVYTDSGTTNTTTTLTPQVTYYAKVTVSDANTLDDITHITLKIFYDSTGSDPDESTRTTANTTGSANITWTKSGNTTVMTAGAGTTWSVNDTATVTPTMTASSGDWVFAFKVGKVATESVGAANWDLHARAFDSLTSGGFYKLDKQVMWYGQIAVSTPTVDFGSLDPGTGFTDGVNVYNTVNATWIANGDFDEKVKSSAQWNGGSNNATLSANATLTKEFALAAWNSDTFASKVVVDTTGVNIYPSPHAQTMVDTGETNLANTLWLKLNAVFPIDTYSGTITYTIANAP